MCILPRLICYLFASIAKNIKATTHAHTKTRHPSECLIDHPFKVGKYYIECSPTVFKILKIYHHILYLYESFTKFVQHFMKQNQFIERKKYKTKFTNLTKFYQ